MYKYNTNMDSYYRKKNNLDVKELTFQCLEWLEFDETEEEEDDNKSYKIRIFGVTKSGESVALKINNFTPFYFLKVSSNFNDNDLKKLLNYLTSSNINFLDKKTSYCLQNFHSHHLVKTKCKIVKRKEFLGFTNNENCKFVRVVFDTKSAFNFYLKNIFCKESLIIDRKVYNIKVYEAQLDNFIKFIHIKDIKPSGWISIKNCITCYDTKCQINIECNWQDVNNANNEYFNVVNKHILQASYDIETYAPKKLNKWGKLYNPIPEPGIIVPKNIYDSTWTLNSSDYEENVIFQIATCFKILGNDDFLLKHIIVLGKCNYKSHNNIIVEEVENEIELLIRWSELINKMDPDILYQYNGDQYDGKYIYVRSLYHKIEQIVMSNLSRLEIHESILKKSIFDSSAYGKTIFFRLVMYGRINFDVLVYFKREYKYNSYKLEDVSQYHLGIGKNDIEVSEIFDAYETKCPELLGKIAKYCIQDTLLPQKLIDKCMILYSQIFMSNVVLVPIKYLLERGQSVKVLSQIMYYTRLENYCIPYFKYNSKDTTELDKFEGATVLDPDKGAYFCPVVVMDFASLYPSIMMAHNLCYSTIVLDNKYLEQDGVEFYNPKWEEVSVTEIKKTVPKKNGNGTKTKKEKNETLIHHNYHFAQNSKGVLPKILEHLGVMRKKYKSLMKTEPENKAIYDKIQLAYKVSMNSIYGVLGSKMIPCKAIAATVTYTGRQMISTTKTYIENNINNIHLTNEIFIEKSKVIYGDTDSVFSIFMTPNLNKFNTLKSNLLKMKNPTNEQLQKLNELRDITMQEAFVIGRLVASEITNKKFKKPNCLEFEKVQNPLILLSKKRYIGKYYETNPLIHDKIDSKGIVLKRRDNPELLKKVYTGMLNPIIEKYEFGINESIQFVKKEIYKLKNGEFDISDLIITKTLRDNYKSDNLPHIRLQLKMYERDPGSAPKTNDRVSYIIMKGNKKNAPLYDRVEEPNYIIKNNLHKDIGLDYYLNKQLNTPLIDFLSLFINDPISLFK